MPVNSVLAPYPFFLDAAGVPLENGFIYVGQPGFEARSTPKASFYDTALTIPTGTASGAAVRTKSGLPVNTSNAPAMIYADGDYSISVCDRNGVLLYSALSQTLAINVGGDVGPVLGSDGNLGAVGIGFANEADTGFVRSGTDTMQTVVGGVLVTQQTPTGTVFAQPVSGAGFTSGVNAIAQPKDPDLTAIAALGSTGIAVRTAADTWAQRQIVSADGSVTITNPAGVAGNIDLSAEKTWTNLGSTACNSGSSAEKTGIATTATQILINVNGISTDGTGDAIIRLFESGVIKATGYRNNTAFGYGSGAEYTTGFGLRLGSAARAMSGYVRLTKNPAVANLWEIFSNVLEDVGGAWVSSFGWVTASNVDGVRLVTSAGSFDGSGAFTVYHN